MSTTAITVTAAHVYLWFILMISVSISLAYNETVPPPTFKGCSIIGFPPLSSDAQVEELQKRELLDFFVGPSTHSESEVMVCDVDDHKQNLLKFLETNNIKPKTLVEDLSKMEISSRHFVDIPLGTMDWKDYHGVENINAWLDEVVKKYPKIISVEVVLKTVDNYEIRFYKIKKPGGSSKKTATYLQCLSRGREWTISGVCTYIIDQLTANSGRYSDILEHVNFYIVPILNPGGYAFTNKTNWHMWNKNLATLDGDENRCNVSGQMTLGVDLNSNWAFKQKTYYDACSPTFSGNIMEGYPEINNLVPVLSKYKDIDTFVDVHCYSQFITLPWAYTKERAEKYDTLMKLAKDAADAAESVAGTKFEAGQFSHLSSFAFGTAMDWASGLGKIPHSFSLAMRPTSRVANGQKYVFPFRVPPNEILPVAKEAWLAILTLATKRKQTSDILSNAAQPKPGTFVLLSAFITLSYVNVD